MCGHGDVCSPPTSLVTTMEQEFNELQQKIQTSVNGMMDNISKKSLRPMQKQSYLCMSKCFDQGGGSVQLY